MTDSGPSQQLSRRGLLRGAGTAGILAAASPVLLAGTPAGAASPASGVSADSIDASPEQVHLTWGADPATSVVISWASPAPAAGPHATVRAGRSTKVTVAATASSYTDGLNGETTHSYHAELTGLVPDTTYAYTVTARNAATAFSATFRTAPTGRAPFRFSSYGDLATPNTAWVLSYGQSTYAVEAVEAQQPLFHLLNGDLCYANLNPANQPDVWRDFANNVQASAAYRPWMPCIGNHELEFDNGPEGVDSYLSRYALPDNGVAGFPGRWYSFQVGSVMVISLDADDVIYQDGSAFAAGPSPLVPAADTGNPPIAAGTSLYVRGYSGGAQTAWLKHTLAAARSDDTVDWIVVQMHQDALSSSMTGNGSDLGIREKWLPLFDRYGVDLVVCGHDHDYERSFPVRGHDPMQGRDVSTGTEVETRRPHPVTTVDNGVFDTTQGTVHLILGGGGTSAPLDDYGVDGSDGDVQAKVFTKRNRPQPGTPAGSYFRPPADAVEDAIWSARRDPMTGYGLAVFEVDPGTTPGGQTSIVVTYLHALGVDPKNPDTGAAGSPNPDYTVFETFALVRPRSDG